MENNISNYALTSIVNKLNEVHLVVFHFYTFTIVELNYNTHEKKLFAIFEAFKIWYYYLEGLAFSINVVIDYKSYEYFSTSKMLT